MTGPQGPAGGVRPEEGASGAGGPPSVGGDRPDPAPRGYAHIRVLPWAAVIAVCLGLVLLRLRDRWTAAQEEGIPTAVVLVQGALANWYLLLPILVAVVFLVPWMRDLTGPFWGEERNVQAPGLDDKP